jgi:hypothetical protein
MLRQLPIRQRVRKALILLAFLSFPITWKTRNVSCVAPAWIIVLKK